MFFQDIALQQMMSILWRLKQLATMSLHRTASLQGKLVINVLLSARTGGYATIPKGCATASTDTMELTAHLGMLMPNLEKLVNQNNSKKSIIVRTVHNC